jgi:putative tryptophan/tyrosine transport system substrate-binding protein
MLALSLGVHMRRREFISLLGGAIMAWPLAARGQQSGKVWRIGMLDMIAPTANSTNLDSFRNGLRDLGYTEGRNLVIEYRSADGHSERFPSLATELVQLKIDLFVTRGTPAALAAKNASETIPIVMAAIAEPSVLVTSIAHPSGNITGLSSLYSDVTAKRFELLKDMLLVLSRVGYLADIGNPAATPNFRREVETAARSLGIQSPLLDVRKPEDIAPAFDAASSQRMDAIIVDLNTVTQTNRQFIALLAASHRLPVIYASREFVEAGGLIAYGVSYPDLYRRAATFVDKIFKGAKPADLPIEQPTKFELVINLRAAKAIGLTIPEVFLLRADEVIE